MTKRTLLMLLALAGCADDDALSPEGQRALIEQPDRECAKLTADQCRHHEECNPDGSMPETCTELTGCASDVRCMVMSGRLLDEARQCVGSLTPLMCRTKPVGCTAAITIAKDPNGRTWQFSGGGSGCVPDHFETLSGSGPTDWPVCN